MVKMSQQAFVNGAYKALEQIKDLHPEYIILKERTHLVVVLRFTLENLTVISKLVSE